VGSEGMRKEVIAMIVARQKRAEERKEKTPFTRWIVVYMVMVRHARRVRNEDHGHREILCTDSDLNPTQFLQQVTCHSEDSIIGI
jgi:hypothetical protein